MTHLANTGEVSLDLVLQGQKLSGLQYLTVLRDPGSIRVKAHLAYSQNTGKLFLVKLEQISRLLLQDRGSS